MTVQHRTTRNRDRVLVRTSIPEPWSVALDHLSADLRQTKASLLMEGIVLLLRHHGFSQNLPEPLPPVNRASGTVATESSMTQGVPSALTSPLVTGEAER
jgi:hypothetical protein